MITHILLWNYKDEVPVEARRAIEAEMAALPHRIPGLQSVTSGAVFRWRVREYQHAAVMLFADRAALDAYQVDPIHKDFTTRFHPATSELAAVDYES